MILRSGSKGDAQLFQIGIVGVRDVEVDDLIRCDFASAMGTICVFLQRGYQDAANREGVFLRRMYFTVYELVAGFAVGDMFSFILEFRDDRGDKVENTRYDRTKNTKND